MLASLYCFNVATPVRVPVDGGAMQPSCKATKSSFISSDCCHDLDDGKLHIFSDLVLEARGNWNDTMKFVTHFIEGSPIKCLVDKHRKRDTLLMLGGSGQAPDSTLGLFNVYDNTRLTNTNFCELLGDISLQEQADTYVAVGALSDATQITGGPYYGYTRRATGFDADKSRAIVIKLMDRLVEDGYANDNRFTVGGLSSGTSNWLNNVILDQDIVDRCIGLLATIGSMASTFDSTFIGGSEDYKNEVFPIMSPLFNQGKYDMFKTMNFSHINWRMYYGNTDQFYGTEASSFQNALKIRSTNYSDAPPLKTRLRLTEEGLKTTLQCSEETMAAVPNAEMLTNEIGLEVTTYTCTAAKTFKVYTYNNVDTWPPSAAGTISGFEVRASHFPVYPGPQPATTLSDFMSGMYVVVFLPSLVQDYIGYAK